MSPLLDPPIPQTACLSECICGFGPVWLPGVLVVCVTTVVSVLFVAIAGLQLVVAVLPRVVDAVPVGESASEMAVLLIPDVACETAVGVVGRAGRR